CQHQEGQGHCDHSQPKTLPLHVLTTPSLAPMRLVRREQKACVPCGFPSGIPALKPASNSHVTCSFAILESALKVDRRFPHGRAGHTTDQYGIVRRAQATLGSAASMAYRLRFGASEKQSAAAITLSRRPVSEWPRIPWAARAAPRGAILAARAPFPSELLL